jgi:glycine/D-amino acid oxidase-like deaminating enzyme
MADSAPGVVIVGGGLEGMTTAYYLAPRRLATC